MKRISSFHELIEQLGNSKTTKRAAIVWAADAHTREAVALALQYGIISPIFVGCRKEAENDPALAPYLSKIEWAEAENSDEAAALAVKMVREGKADIIMKGLLNTDNLLRAVLNKEHGILPKGTVLTHITACEAPGLNRITLFTDAAVIPFPNPEQRHAQIQYCVDLARNLGIEIPKVALIHCSEKVDAKHFPYTEDYLVCKEKAAKGEFGPCIVDGPLDVKTSLSHKALAEKGLVSDVNGEADILVFPDIESGNTYYKMLTLFCNSLNAGILAGALAPVVLPSRGDTSEGKFLSLALAASV